MTTVTSRRIRTVRVNERGQIVIPEDIRQDFGIRGNSTLVLVESSEGLVFKKESEFLERLNNNFWDALSKRALQNAWSKEDEVWDKIAEKSLSPKK
ncbi:TPA: AbrB/MazE/SpoVT family DNA-binding domain-containing protein [Candidatus Woesearchaeota archaeon]|nr:AbrB/MazE/SpoVT family DNA-binding domain-containing protein [Candidatus Woesearchaeota archaeon]